MPLYNYECEECGHQFDTFNTISNREVMACPECGSGCRIIITSITVLGLYKGPSALRGELIFDRPRPEHDIKETARRVEAAGNMTPDKAKWIKKKLKAVKNQPQKKVDYQKGGHPLDN